MADENQVSRNLVEPNANVFEQSDDYRVFQVRMKIEKDINARRFDCPDVPKHRPRFRVMQLRFERYVEALQAVSYGPAK